MHIVQNCETEVTFGILYTDNFFLMPADMS